MATIKEEAMAYKPQHTNNIADLERVPTNLELKEEVAKAGTPDEFKYKYFEVKGEKYRVPGIVLGHIKGLLAKFPDLKYVQVLKQGAGTATTYQVIPVAQPQEGDLNIA